MVATVDHQIRIFDFGALKNQAQVLHPSSHKPPILSPTELSISGWVDSHDYQGPWID